jgi:ABC-type transporter Mla subunit MlaD
MDSTLDLRFVERQIAEQLSSLAREAEVGPSPPPANTKKTSHDPPATTHQSANWRHVAFGGALLAASIGIAAWWWSSSAHTMAPSQAAPEAVAPKAAAPSAITLSDLAQQLQPLTGDLAALRQTVEQLKVRQEQLVRDNENVAGQLKASQEELARNKTIIDETKAIQTQMARENQTLAERLSASQEQLTRVIANASTPTVMPEELKVSSPEEPKAGPEIPLPRPRHSATVAQARKPTPSPARPQAEKPQPSFAWPWSAR